MSLKMPEIDAGMIARRPEIVAAMRVLLPEGSTSTEEDRLRVHKADGLTAYGELPLTSAAGEFYATHRAALVYCLLSNHLGRVRMKFCSAMMLAAALCMGAAVTYAAEDAVETHQRNAKDAAGLDFQGTLVRTCIAPVPLNPGGGGGGGGAQKVPDRSTWYAEPAKVYDNLYFLGTKIHSSWALTTSQGIILIDTLYNYAVEPEIVDGMKKMGLDPAQVKYVLISHGHGDHDEGANLMQQRYGAKIVMGGPDWDAIEKTTMPGGTPKRDIVGTDGQKITLGDTTVTIVATPGHTPGTLSFLFSVKDNGMPATVAYSGGTALQVIYRDIAKLNGYSDSEKRFAKLAAAQNATILMSNHSEFDNAYIKARLLAVRKPGEAHPFDVGTEAIARYLTVKSECALAQAERLKRPNS